MSERESRGRIFEQNIETKKKTETDKSTTGWATQIFKIETNTSLHATNGTKKIVLRQQRSETRSTMLDERVWAFEVEKKIGDFLLRKIESNQWPKIEYFQVDFFYW